MAAGDRKSTDGMTGVDPVVQEAVDNWSRGWDWESQFRALALQDTKFANGDADNNWQWPDGIYKDRDLATKPSLTINKTQQHILRVVNDARKNNPAPKVSPIGGQATKDSAEIYEGLVRHIGNRSQATAIRMAAFHHTVESGIGYWRVNSAYADDEDDVFAQEIIIEPIPDQMGVMLDPDIKLPTGADAMWGIVWENVSQKTFKRDYPDIDLSFSQPLIGIEPYQGWISADDVRVAEYYRLTNKKDEWIWIEDPKGTQSTFKLSEIPSEWKEEFDRLVEDDNTTRLKRRKIQTKQLEWYKIAGAQIISRRKLKGQYVPIIRCVGREKKIDGKLYRAGLTRALKDPQRMYNYNTSAAAEIASGQTKSPWLVAAEAIEGNEAAWRMANVRDYAFLTWKHLDSDGQPMPPPQRIDPPQPATAFMEGLKIAAMEMEMASGQYAPQQVDAQQMAKTPQAIDQRVEASDLATYDFLENLALAMAYETQVIIDLAPHVYDTERVIKILGKDNKTVSEVTVMPGQKEATKQDKESGDDIRVLFNPSAGRYSVTATVGPAFQTARKEAWSAFTQVAVASPELVAPAADLMFQNADFEMADELAKRWRKQLENTMPYLFDDALPGPALQQAKAELDQTQKDLATALQKMAELQLRLKGKEEMRDIQAHEADTKRLAAAGNVVRDFHELGGEGDTQILEQMVRKIMLQMLNPKNDLDDVREANKPTLDAQEDDNSATLAQ